jgi:hypothetical protein
VQTFRQFLALRSLFGASLSPLNYAYILARALANKRPCRHRHGWHLGPCRVYLAREPPRRATRLRKWHPSGRVCVWESSTSCYASNVF